MAIVDEGDEAIYIVVVQGHAKVHIKIWSPPRRVAVRRGRQVDLHCLVFSRVKEMLHAVRVGNKVKGSQMKILCTVVAAKTPQLTLTQAIHDRKLR